MPDEGSALALAQLSASFFMIRSAALGPPNGPMCPTAARALLLPLLLPLALPLLDGQS